MTVHKVLSTLILAVALIACEKKDISGTGGFGENSRLGREILTTHSPSKAINDYMSGPVDNDCAGRFQLSEASRTPANTGNMKGKRLLEYLNHNYPKNCGYRFQGWTSRDSAQLNSSIRLVARGQKPQCHQSNCSTASYLALLEAIKGTPHERKIGSRVSMDSPLYQSFVVKSNSIERTFKDFGLGPYRKINPLSSSNLGKSAQSGWPAAGDFMLINRRNGSGHMTVFSHFKGTGSSAQVCFWSSNKGTRGMGVKCESIKRLSSIHVGRVES